MARAITGFNSPTSPIIFFIIARLDLLVIIAYPLCIRTKLFLFIKDIFIRLTIFI